MSAFHLSNDVAAGLGNGAVGGAILAASCAALMFLSGKVSGMSGISSGLVLEEGEDWHFSYIAGLLGAGFVLDKVYPEAFGAPVEYSIPIIVTGGFLVGVGTKLAGGCTSGHGLMGLSRFSPRSLAAVLTFMGAGAAAASVAHLPSIEPLLLDKSQPLVALFEGLPYPATLIPSALLVVTTVIHHRAGRVEEGIEETSFSVKRPAAAQKPVHGILRKFSPRCLDGIAAACGFVFGIGLGVSGMCSTAKVWGFLAPFNPSGWDPSLSAVMGSGVVLLALAWPWMKARNVVSVCGARPVGANLQIGTTPANTKVDARLLLGATLFGAGWGLVGACPGPSWVALGAGRAAFAVFVPSMLGGMIAKDALLR